jgi:hypothetical protein
MKEEFIYFLPSHKFFLFNFKYITKLSFRHQQKIFFLS